MDSVDACTLDLCLRDYQVTFDGDTTCGEASNEIYGRRYFRSRNLTEITWQEVCDLRHKFLLESIIMCWEPDGTPKKGSWKFEDLGHALQLYASSSAFLFCMDYGYSHWHWADQIADAINGRGTTPVYFGTGASGEYGIVHFNNTNMSFYSVAGTSYIKTTLDVVTFHDESR